MSTNRIEDTIKTLDAIFASPGLLGFTPLALDLRRALNYNAIYPPRNIINLDENHWLVEVAVAGFAKDELMVEVNNNHLIISGSSKSEEVPEGEYVHHGLARRDFQFTIRLGEHVKVTEDTPPFIQNGLLIVNLNREIPEPKTTHVYEIVSKDTAVFA